MTGSRDVFLHPGVRRLATTQASVATRSQLLGLGITARHVATQVEARRWTRVTSDVVVLHNGPPGPEAERWIAVLAAPAPVAVGSWTALAVHGLTGWSRPGLHVVVARGAKTPGRRGVVVHESRRPAPEDIVRVGGLPVHRVERCAVDAAAWQTSPRTAVGLLAAVVQQRLASPDGLAEQLERVGKIRFHRLMRASLADLRGGADALSEIDLSRLCRSYGLPEPTRQVRRQDARGRTRFLDAEWRLRDGRRLVVEVDGIGHMEVGRWYDDLLRDAELGHDASTTAIRLPASALRVEPLRVVAILARHLLA